MTKYLVFKLEERFIDVQTIVGGKAVTADITQPCFRLITEFDAIVPDKVERFAKGFAEAYSLTEKVRTLVVKGEVFGD